MNIQKAITVIRAMKGSSLKTTLSQKTLKLVAEKEGGEFKTVIDRLTTGLKNPSVTLSAKSSERGYTIFAANIKDGNKSVGNAAISFAELGKESGQIVKSRTTLTPKEGVKITARGHFDTSKKLNLSEGEVNLSIKNGEQHLSETVGDAFKVTADAKGTELPREVSNMVNDKSNGVWKVLKDFLAGKKTESECANKMDELNFTNEERELLKDSLKKMFILG